MPSLPYNPKFTDHNLKLFYGHVLNHYQQCLNRPGKPDLNAIYAELYLAMEFALMSPSGSLHHLHPSEHTKVHRAFDCIFKSFPEYRNLVDNQPFPIVLNKPVYDSNIYIINTYKRYDCNNSDIFSWIIIASLLPHHHCGSSAHVPSGGSVHHHSSGCCGGSGNNHSHGDSQDCAKLLVALVIITVLATAAVAAFIALFYMLHEFLNSAERFYYDEGWLKAALMLISSAVFGTLSALSTLHFVSIPLIALAVFAGLNPVGIVIASTVLLTIIGAGLGCLAMSLLYNSIEHGENQDAMDPSDPLRFRVSEADESRLLQNNIDPLKVRCAIVALRAEMAKESGNDHSIPSFLPRFFGQNDNIQKLLHQVRELRSGSISEVKVGDLLFDCTLQYGPENKTSNYIPVFA